MTELTLPESWTRAAPTLRLRRTVSAGRRWRNRLATVATAAMVVLALTPLFALLGFTMDRGVRRLDPSFLTHSMAGVGPLSPGGGIYHAMVGTVEQVGLASLFAVPLGLL